MKKLILSILAAAPALAFAQQGNFTLNGKITALKTPATGYLIYVANGKQVTDSTEVTKGTFLFSGTLTEPVKARLVLDHQKVGLKNVSALADNMVLFLEPTAISVTAQDSVKNAVIKGSKLNADNIAFSKTIAAPVAVMKSISREYAGATEAQRKDPTYKATLGARFEQATENIKTLQSSFVKANPDADFSLFALNEAAMNRLDIGVVDQLYKGLSARVRNTPAGLRLAKAIDEQRATAVNAMAPDFTQNDVNDQPVKLSDFRGKYVLLDFWASWCVPCRQENPNVVAAYNSYKDKGFTVLGVSLDQPDKKEAWLAAIAKDGLSWTQVSDLKFWKNEVAQLYRVQAIPQNFLIDPSGKIVATNLRGEALQAKLAELIK